MRRILFLCTGNSARSIMAEAYFNHARKSDWRAFSAGSNPAGAPHPLALATLKHAKIPVANNYSPRSKSWDEFAEPGAPIMDVVVTVCDNAANETCPVWPTRTGTAAQCLHWSFPDPAAASGSDSERAAAFEAVFLTIRSRIDEFLKDESK